MVIWLGTHDTCDLAFHIGSRSPHGIIGHHEQTAIPDYFIDCHAVAVGPGPAPLGWVLSLHAGNGWVYNDDRVLTHSAKHFKRALHQHAQQVAPHLLLGSVHALFW